MLDALLLGKEWYARLHKIYCCIPSSNRFQTFNTCNSQTINQILDLAFKGYKEENGFLDYTTYHIDGDILGTRPRGHKLLSYCYTRSRVA